jgi:hypothetical protein
LIKFVSVTAASPWKHRLVRQVSSQFVDVIHHSGHASRNQTLVAIPDEERAISAIAARTADLPDFGLIRQIRMWSSAL